MICRQGATDQAFITRTTLSPKVFGKSAASYAFNDISLVLNSGAVGTDTSAVIPMVTQMFIGGAGAATAGQINGHIKKLAFYPKRLTNEELQGLTS